MKPQRCNRPSPAALLRSMAVLAMLGIGTAGAQEVGGGSKGAVTGAAGGATSEGANSTLEHCDQALGTIGVVEDQNAGWYRTLQSYKLGSTVPVLRMMIQQSNCFVVVERGAAMHNMNMERQLQKSGEMREGSNFGGGQMVAADPLQNASEGLRIQKALEPFWAAHRVIRVDPEARSPKHTAIDRGMEGQWRVRQVLLDEEEDNDWYFDVIVDLTRSRDAARPVMTLERLGT